jgi:hypothetical protein
MPPSRISNPLEPVMTSLPPLPSTWSAPAPVKIPSGPLEPMTTSLPLPV